MMLAASEPDDAGALVINGAPMSYWGGAWSEGEGDNPMRYMGGLLGGTRLVVASPPTSATGCSTARTSSRTSRTSNPANTFWDKYYRLLRQHRHASRRASSSSSAGGAATT